MTSNQCILSSAPGKVILHGEHAVVHGKNAIAFSVDLRTRVLLKLTPELNQVSLSFKNLVDEISFSIDQLSLINFDVDLQKKDVITFNENFVTLFDPLVKPHSHKLCSQSMDAILATLFLYFSMSKMYANGKLISLEIKESSDLPIGAGMGSSAAFCVSMAAAFLKAFSKTDKICQELTCKWAFECEKLFHGKPSGIDNNICSFGGAILYKNGLIRERLNTVNFLPIILVYTNVKRNTKFLVKEIGARRSAFPNIVNYVMDSIDHISLEQWQLIKDKFEPQKSKMLIEMNQHLLNSIGAGHSAIDKVVVEAKKHNLCAKLTGAGGGGTMFIVLDQDTSLETKETLIQDLQNHGFQCWQVSIDQKGLQCDWLDVFN